MIIWLLTWNCENQAPPDTMLDALINQAFRPQGILLPPASCPDIFVINLQEAKPFDKRNINSFVSDRLASIMSAPTWQGQQYKSILSSSVSGRTKRGKGICHIHLGVLVKQNLTDSSDPGWQLPVAGIQGIPGTHIVARGSGAYKHGLRYFGCKGGAFASVAFQTRRIGFIGAHLEGPGGNAKPDKTAKCEVQIQELLKALTRSAPTANVQQINTELDSKFDIVFFMGDLNYRLHENPNQTISGVANTTTLNSSITVDQLALAIAHPPTRNRLQQHFDALGVAGASASPLTSTFGFQFPLLGGHILPTYKRNYKIQGNTNPCSQLVGLHQQQLAATPQQLKATLPQQRNLIQQCYFPKGRATDLVASKKRPGFFETGWLDRIGFRITQNQVQTQLPVFEAFDNLILSDHTPVLMKIDLA